MSFFNIGLAEVLILIALVVVLLGPKDLEKNVRKAGRMIRTILRSENWQNMHEIYQQAKSYPQKLMKELELEELTQQLNRDLNDAERKTKIDLSALSAEKEATDEPSDNKPN